MKYLKQADRLAYGACLALPLALLHARAAAEILIAGIGVVFLLRCALLQEWRWLRQPFAAAAGAWWFWGVICSVLGTGGLGLGLAAVRLPLLAMALGHWLLAGPEGAARRRMLWRVLAASICWIGLESWQQILTGRNLFGSGRWEDGALTGPFHKPRAGPEYILLLFPTLVPAVMGLLARPGWRARAGGLALAVLAALTLVLIGQRMPVALMGLGLAGCALLVPRLRVAALGAALAGVALIGALPWVAPASSAKLVGETLPQIAHFSQSDYGLIFTRAITVAELRPWLGHGYDGFRRGCHEFWSMHGVEWLGIPTANLNGGFAACNLHPHNYYLEALDNGGVPGLVLFTLMVGSVFWTLGRGLGRRAPALLLGIFVGAMVAFWPVASTSAFTALPNGGWVFLLIGLGFAASGERGPPVSV